MVAGLIATLLAPVTGGLFGLAYGTAIRIGYEQIYPALFPTKGPMGLTREKKDVIAGLVQMYDIIGGKGAHEFGINLGFQHALKGLSKEMANNPDILKMIQMEAGVNGIGVTTIQGASGEKTLKFESLVYSGVHVGEAIDKTKEQIKDTNIKNHMQEDIKMLVTLYKWSSGDAINWANKEASGVITHAELMVEVQRIITINSEKAGVDPGTPIGVDPTIKPVVGHKVSHQTLQLEKSRLSRDNAAKWKDVKYFQQKVSQFGDSGNWKARLKLAIKDYQVAHGKLINFLTKWGKHTIIPHG